MAKRSNNSLGRRSYGGKPYDANNSFVKKMATKVTDLIPQRFSKWFSPQDSDDASNQDPDLINGEEETRQPPAKRPRIRMDVTHPPGTFSIKTLDKNQTESHESPVDNGNGEFVLEPTAAGSSDVCKMVSSTPVVPEARNSKCRRPQEITRLATTNNGGSNGVDDNSESGESTSGCSSLIPQTNRQEGASNLSYGSNVPGGRNRPTDDKSSFANHLQSPRCLFLTSGGSRDSLSSRRPSFNASIMSNNGNNMERSSALSSPFYSGNVTFGGANAVSNYKRSRSLFNSGNEFQLKVPRRTSVRVKPSNVESIDASGMSQTAKRILEAMEYFSSPISDAKKIPMKQLSVTPGGTKRPREERTNSTGPPTRVGLRHLTKELAVPTVPEMLKLRRRQKLQDTTVAARKIISAKSGPALSSSWFATETPTTEDYQLRTEVDHTWKHQGKMRTRNRNPKEEGPVPRVNLPSISLPITSLPSFEPLPEYTAPTIPSNRNNKEETDDSNNFKFASPIKMSETSWNVKSINNFSFSKPINANETSQSSKDSNSGSRDSMDSKSNESSGVAMNFMWSGSSTAPRLKVKTKQNEPIDKKIDNTVLFGNSPVKEMTKLKSVTVDSGLSSFDQSSSVEIWECSECYIKNDSKENSCIACKASKPRSTGVKEIPEDAKRLSPAKNIPTNMNFGAQFKMSSDQWECKACLVRNQATSVKCVSCTSPKPSSGVSKNSNSSNSSTIPTGFDFPEKFKPAEGSWECPGCMLRNPDLVITCPCCSASKPSLIKNLPKKTSLEDESTRNLNRNEEGTPDDAKLMDKFKPAPTSWECSSCLVRNSETANACVCCATSKPGAPISAKSVKEETAPVLPQSNWSEKFKKPAGSWTCDSCMLQNKAETTECVACNAVKPGAAPKPQTSSKFTFGVSGSNNGGFKFGLDKADVKSTWGSGSEIANGFTFGAKSAVTDSNPGQFKFGIPRETEKTEAAKVPVNASGFVFASPKSAKDNSPKSETKGNDKSNESDDTTVTGEKKNLMPFVFGVPKSVRKRSVDNALLETSKEQVAEISTKARVAEAQFVFGIPKSSESSTNDTKLRFEASTSEKPLIFGNQTQQITSHDSNAINPLESVSSQEQSETSVSSSNTTSTTNTSERLPRTSFPFSEPKSKMASQTAVLGFKRNSVEASSSVFSVSGSSVVRDASADSSANKTATPSFGVTNSIAPSTGFGLAASSASSSALIADTSAGESKNCFAPAADKPKSFFGISGEKNPPVFGGTNEKNSQIFGNPENKLTPTFGTTDKPITPGAMFNSTPASSFGANAAVAPQPVFWTTTAPPVFGSNAAAPSFGAGNSVGTNIFASAGKSNNAAPTSTNNPGLFTFGGANNQTIPSQTTPSTFSFANENAGTVSSAVKPIFAFGNSSNTSQPNPNECFGTPATNTGTFGSSAATVTNPAPSPFTYNAPAAKQDPPLFGQTSAPIPSMFGTQPTASGLGQQANAPPTFANNAPPSSTGFTFGAAPPATGGFNFGGGMAQQAPVSSGGFNFNAPSPSPAIAFDPNTRPSFNFTGGTAPTAFNATPQPVTARKIKKAVRRMQQR
ncbi:nuclear pore complex protein Nup153 [Venturia canescens]|uniref:nuclear pore complex protein Nup153 n=1 Tax=Venturia canescens TaxID=32260 RepID=UPI001C9BEAF9|nr:nuclear pore complex protein Nup153 [Venturia canescens]